MSTWISVNDRLPSKGEQVIILLSSRVIPEIGYQMSGYWFSEFDDEPRAVTHWQPLPDPPEDR